MPRSDLLKRFVAPQQDLGPFLRFEVLVPLTIFLFVVGGKFFTLPPGPLCDEGMVLFMEGGCDYGWSNVFFFAKVSLLLIANLAMVVSWQRPPVAWGGFALHFALLGCVAYALRSDTACDTYYSHPNGSLGQMILEMVCFSIFGIALARVSATAPWPARGLAILGWNGFHVGLFYLYLNLFDHWTWQHTGLLGGSMLLVGLPLLAAAPSGAAPWRRPFGARGEVLTGWEILSAAVILVAFSLAVNPWEFGMVAALCGAVGLATVALVGRFLGSRTSWVIATLVALAIPAVSVVRNSMDYREQARYADQVLGAVPALTLEEAKILETAARGVKQIEHGFERGDLVASHSAVGEIANRVLAPDDLRYGTTLSLFVPLPGESYGRFYSSWSGGPHGDVIHLVTDASYYEGYEFILDLQAAGQDGPVTWWQYAADTALRLKPPQFYAGSTLLDSEGQVRAMLVAATLPRRVIESEGI